MLDAQLLDRLSATWRAHGAPIEDALAPNRTVEFLTSDDGTLHVDLPEELRTWWAWHDGATKGRRPIHSWMMGPNLTPMSSTWSRDWWQTMMAEAATMATTVATDMPGTEMADTDYWWRETWVPLFSNGVGGTLVADCGLGPAGVTPIRLVDWHHEKRLPPATASLGQVVEWWIEAIELGIWTWDKDRGMWVRTRWDPEIEQRYGLLI
jgi:cell wall assembly regulator SMI1